MPASKREARHAAGVSEPRKHCLSRQHQRRHPTCVRKSQTWGTPFLPKAIESRQENTDNKGAHAPSPHPIGMSHESKHKTHDFLLSFRTFNMLATSISCHHSARKAEQIDGTSLGMTRLCRNPNLPHALVRQPRPQDFHRLLRQEAVPHLRAQFSLRAAR